MSEIACTHDGTTVVLTVANEAKLNALTMGMLGQIEDHLVAIERNQDVRAVILTGVGQKAFCCGADIAEWGPLSPIEFARFWVSEGPPCALVQAGDRSPQRPCLWRRAGACSVLRHSGSGAKYHAGPA